MSEGNIYQRDETEKIGGTTKVDQRGRGKESYESNEKRKATEPTGLTNELLHASGYVGAKELMSVMHGMLEGKETPDD